MKAALIRLSRTRIQTAGDDRSNASSESRWKSSEWNWKPEAEELSVCRERDSRALRQTSTGYSVSLSLFFAHSLSLWEALTFQSPVSLSLRLPLLNHSSILLFVILLFILHDLLLDFSSLLLLCLCCISVLLFLGLYMCVCVCVSVCRYIVYRHTHVGLDVTT